VRYVTFRIVPEGNAINAVEQRLADEPAVTREAMHDIRTLADGTGVLLCELSGERERVEAVFEEHPDVITYSVSEVDGRLYAHVHQTFPGDVGRLLDIQHRHGLIVDTPTEYADDGSFVVTVLGEQGTIQEALADVPDNLGLEIEAIGEYRPEAERLFGELTERQRETLRVALERGYFSDPRGATYEEIAEDLGCRPETVGEHLRKAQATLFSKIVPDRSRPLQ
jgi:predicted DNA binding protein